MGCAPGKWQTFMAKEFGLKPSGIEYSEAGMNATLRNFKLLAGVGLYSGRRFFSDKAGPSIRCGDVFGFIEHFTDVDEVVGVAFTVVEARWGIGSGIPNFCGINYFLQRILDKGLLDKHNLNIMNLDYFAHLTNRFNLKPIFLDYIGSFEPALPISKPRIENPLQFMVKSFIWVGRRVRRIKMFDLLNNRLFSSYILAIYKKDENN